MARFGRSLPLLCTALMFIFTVAAFGQGNSECSGEEAWVGVGGGLPGGAMGAAEMDGALYVVHRAPGPHDTDEIACAISKWDGSAWSRVTAFRLRVGPDAPGTVTSVTLYQGELYLAGEFAAVNGLEGTAKLARWSPTESWRRVGADLDVVKVLAVQVYKGELYCALIGKLGFNSSIFLLRWDGTTWRIVFDGYSIRGVASLAVWKNALYISGEFDTQLGPNTDGVFRWDGTTWSIVGQLISGWNNYLAVINDSLYLYSPIPMAVAGSVEPRTELLRWDGTAWQNLPSPPLTDLTFKDVVEVFDHQLYAVARVSDPDTSGRLWTDFIRRFDGSAWHTVSNFDQPVEFMRTYKGNLYVGGAFGKSCGAPLNNVAQLCNDLTCARITGTVYNDQDGDCARGAAEPGLRRRLLEIQPGPHYAVTDESGHYTRYVDAGNTYVVSVVPRKYWSTGCPADNRDTVRLVSPGDRAVGIDFGMRAAAANVRDLRVSVASSPARRGRQLTYAITFENVGTETMSGTVRFRYDPILTIDSSHAPAARSSSGTAEWDFTDLDVGELRTIRVWAAVPLSAPNMDICSRAEADPLRNEPGATDRDSLCVPITASYDPNDITVAPMREQENGNINPDDSVLTYTVRFQNTGNDTAFKVVVVDTLSPHLDVASIRLGASSHPFSFHIGAADALVWTFNNIMLPDSGADEPGSHGYFKYSVRLKPGLAAGTQIPNRAGIYFDFNTPVATNTVVSVLSASADVETLHAADAVALYPNPARDRLYVRADMRPGAAVTVQDLLGRTLRTFAHDGSGAMEIDLSALPAGAYLLAVETRLGTVTRRVAVTR